MSPNLKDLVVRAAHTFYQAAGATFLAGLINVLTAFQKNIGTGKAAALALIVGAIAAGISAVKTAYVQKTS